LTGSRPAPLKPIHKGVFSEPKEQDAQSMDADDFTVILTASSSPLRRLKGQPTVRFEKSWRLLS
jgi:hypothetical protein